MQRVNAYTLVRIEGFVGFEREILAIWRDSRIQANAADSIEVPVAKSQPPYLARFLAETAASPYAHKETSFCRPARRSVTLS